MHFGNGLVASACAWRDDRGDFGVAETEKEKDHPRPTDPPNQNRDAT